MPTQCAATLACVRTIRAALTSFSMHRGMKTFDEGPKAVSKNKKKKKRKLRKKKEKKEKEKIWPGQRRDAERSSRAGKQRKTSACSLPMIGCVGGFLILSVSLLLRVYRGGAKDGMLAGRMNSRGSLATTPVDAVEWAPSRPFSDFLRKTRRASNFKEYGCRPLESPAVDCAEFNEALCREKLPAYQSTVSRHFGPYFDPSRPLGRLDRVFPRHEYEVVNRSLADMFASEKDAGPPYLYLSRELHLVSQRLMKDVEPIQFFISANPSRTSINLWMGEANLTAPCHYDGYLNFFVMLSGSKRFLLAPPSAHDDVAPFPFLHPSHGQCQKDISSHSKTLYEAVLQPGDLPVRARLMVSPGDIHHTISERQRVG